MSDNGIIDIDEIPRGWSGRYPWGEWEKLLPGQAMEVQVKSASNLSTQARKRGLVAAERIMDGKKRVWIARPR